MGTIKAVVVMMRIAQLILKSIALLGLILLVAGSQRGGITSGNPQEFRKFWRLTSLTPIRSANFVLTASQLPIDTTSIFMNGVLHHNQVKMLLYITRVLWKTAQSSTVRAIATSPSSSKLA